MTVAQMVFQRVQEELKISDRIPRSQILKWTIEYQDEGKKKTANSATIDRVLRKLTSANYLGIEGGGRSYFITKSNGKPMEVVEDPHVPEEGEPEPQYPVLLTRDGNKYVRIVRSMQERDELIAQGARAL